MILLGETEARWNRDERGHSHDGSLATRCERPKCNITCKFGLQRVLAKSFKSEYRRSQNATERLFCYFSVSPSKQAHYRSLPGLSDVAVAYTYILAVARECWPLPLIGNRHVNRLTMRQPLTTTTTATVGCDLCFFSTYWSSRSTSCEAIWSFPVNWHRDCSPNTRGSSPREEK